MTWFANTVPKPLAQPWLKLVGLTDFGLADGQTTLHFFCVDRILVLTTTHDVASFDGHASRKTDRQTENNNLHVISISIEFWNAIQVKPVMELSTFNNISQWLRVGLGCWLGVFLIHLYLYRMVFEQNNANRSTILHPSQLFFSTIGVKGRSW